MRLAAGDLDRRVRIERDTPGDPTPEGEPTSAWALVATVWAEMKPLRGRELFAAEQVAAEVDTRFRIRWRTDVTPERMRIVDARGRVYDIQSVQEIGRAEGLEILAMARGETPEAAP